MSKYTLSLLLVIIILQLTAIIPVYRSDSPGNETDYTALLAIKSQLVDHPNGVLSSWNNSVHHCNWQGITCGRGHNRVIALDLNSRGLSGTVSPSIGNLSFIRYISLSNNSLAGQIHPEFGRLIGLRYIDLENNTFVGEIPANISECINLRQLIVGGNKLQGKLPKNFGALSKLKTLSIQFNNLTGPLFELITNFTSLEYIYASSNALTGTIPHSIGRFQNLTMLYAAGNNFSGKIPSSLFNISSLQEIELLYNYLHGQLPNDIGLTLPRLTNLNIAENNFFGVIPPTLLNLTCLENIALGENLFTGEVPHDFGRLRNLEYLLLENNNLVGDINFINTLVNCSKLSRLDFRYNGFTGTLSQTIANLSTTLTRFSLGTSAIKGVIPAGITNLINLVCLELSHTEIEGTIPGDIWKLRNLETLYFGYNRLTGNIPESLGNISRLSVLNLEGNRLEGRIPSSLGNSKNLLLLFLSENHLSGSLSKELFGGTAQFVQLNLYDNRLEGSIPSEISQQKHLQFFNVFRNNLSGVIPDGLGSCLELQYLYLHGNNLHGIIPKSFRDFSGLLLIDLSNNNLSGQIPSYFANFPLLNLNFSYNNFEGMVPTEGVFKNVSAVSLVGNKELCGGIPELHLPRCIQQNNSKKKTRMSEAIKLTIIVLCAFGGVVILATLMYLTCLRKNRRYVSSGALKRDELLKVSYNMLLKATGSFSSENLLGEGHFGSVYKGILDGKTVAIKVLNLQQHGAPKSFMAECKALRNIRHRKLVPIITACSSIDFQQKDFKALVYEFMPNGSLDNWLHDEAGNLSLLQRVDIAIDVAQALNYLHQECEIPIVHRDLKPSNVLLDGDMVARVGDFGLAKFLAEPGRLNESNTTAVRGTVGYVAPEYGLGSEASVEGDIYSYGILLLELMTGKRPTNTTFEGNNHLHKYVQAALPDDVLQIADSTLANAEIIEDVNDQKTIQEAHQRKAECILSVLNIGLACSNHVPQHRMKINDVLTRLQASKDNLVNIQHRRNNYRRIIN